MPFPARVATILATFPQYGTHTDVLRLPLRTGLALEQQAGRLRRERLHDMALAARLAQIDKAADFQRALGELEV